MIKFSNFATLMSVRQYDVWSCMSQIISEVKHTCIHLAGILSGFPPEELPHVHGPFFFYWMVAFSILICRSTLRVLGT